MRTRITQKQRDQLASMFCALYTIAKHFETTNELRNRYGEECGTSYEVALEMSYKNIQREAYKAIKDIDIKSLMETI